MLNPLAIFAILTAVLSIVAFIAAVLALRKRKFLGGTIGLLLGLLFLSLGALFATIAVGIKGYRALIREEIAAVVKIQSKNSQEFNAHFRLADGEEVNFLIAGDEIYVDAHILKWKPILNFLGLHTAYELDRVAGRYTRLEDGQSKPRTVFHLSPDGAPDCGRGIAWVVDPATNAKLRVRFFWPFSGDYWIIDLGPDYEYTVVGHPSRDYLWILSRTPQMDEERYQRILERVRQKGYDLSRLVKTQQPD